MAYLSDMNVRSTLFALFATLALSFNACVGFAQSTDESPPAPQAAVEPIAPYDSKLLRLSEVLGSIHYLRALCGANEGAKWRNMMAEIVQLEQPGPKRRAQLVAHFNRGFRSFEGTYSSCTASALLAAERYMKEGMLLSNQITSRYGR